MNKLIYILLFLFPLSVLADDHEDDKDQYLMLKENTLSDALEELRSAPTDEERHAANDRFIKELEEILEYPGVMDYEFSKLKSISTIKSPDGEFRIFNWNVENNELVHSHYCYIVRPWRGNKNIVHELKEDKVTLPPRPQDILTPERWYGALYYNIIPVQKGSKTLYTMLGYNGNDRSTNRKILDVFHFKRKHMRMGYPIFQEEQGSKEMKNRVFFEYSDKASISVNMHDKIGAIVFDHLIPEQKNLKGMYDYYIPDMSYDAYEWKNEMWRYREDVVAYNDHNKKVKQYIPGGTEDEDSYREVEDKWVDPVDPNTPTPNGSDATAPIEVAEEKDKPKDVSDSKDEPEKVGWFRRLFSRKDKAHSAIGDTKAEKRSKKRKAERIED